jgi:hypothetical protein
VNGWFASGNNVNKKVVIAAVCVLFGGPGALFADQNSPEWVQTQIKDALRAAPPTVTADAKIYAFKENGERVLVRDGDGPYTCVASGSNSLSCRETDIPLSGPSLR